MEFANNFEQGVSKVALKSKHMIFPCKIRLDKCEFQHPYENYYVYALPRTGDLTYLPSSYSKKFQFGSWCCLKNDRVSLILYANTKQLLEACKEFDSLDIIALDPSMRCVNVIGNQFHTFYLISHQPPNPHNYITIYQILLTQFTRRKVALSYDSNVIVQMLENQILHSFAARTQRTFRKNIADPSFMMCRNRLCHEFYDLIAYKDSSTYPVRMDLSFRIYISIEFAFFLRIKLLPSVFMTFPFSS